MYWVIQDNDFKEPGFATLIGVLDKFGLPYSLHRVVPFVGELVPDVDPSGPVIVIGSYSMRHVARVKRWQPGCFDLKGFDFRLQRFYWGDHMLNADGRVHTFDAIQRPSDPFFLRPISDEKTFAGQVIDWNDYVRWRGRIERLSIKEDNREPLLDSLVMVCQPKVIYREYRAWIVDGKAVTASQYKIGDLVVYSDEVEPAVIDFVVKRAQEWSPVRAFCMDVAQVEDGYRIVEINTLNAAGFYAANIGKLVEALESMGYGD